MMPWYSLGSVSHRISISFGTREKRLGVASRITSNSGGNNHENPEFTVCGKWRHARLWIYCDRIRSRSLRNYSGSETRSHDKRPKAVRGLYARESHDFSD